MGQELSSGGSLGGIKATRSHNWGGNMQPTNSTSFHAANGDPMAQSLEAAYAPQPTAWEDDDYAAEAAQEATACTTCGGDAYVMGTLGRTTHTRCRNCGADGVL
jgi:ribosomal protein L37E